MKGDCFEKIWGQNECNLNSIVFVLAQLVAPPIQPGPVRLPQKAFSSDQPESARPTLIQIPSSADKSNSTPNPESQKRQVEGDWIPEVLGNTIYIESELKTILRPCAGSPSSDTLQNCATTLSAKLTGDGYVNSRVFIQASPLPGQLEVVEGRLAEVRVNSEDLNLEKVVLQQLNPLIGNVLHLPTLQESLINLRKESGVGQIQGSMSRLGSNPAQAVLIITVDPKPPSPWSGELSLRNDGNGGTGQWRTQGILLKNSLLKNTDSFLVYQELNADNDPELGSTISSISYVWPISKKWNFTTSVGYSRRQLVEASGISHDLSFRQFQGLGQIDTVLYESKNQFWSAFAGLSVNRNDSYLEGRSIPLVLGGGEDGWLTSGYLRAGVNGSGRSGQLLWNSSIYGLQGIAGLTKNQHLQNLSFYDVKPGQARAVGSFNSFGWMISPSLTLNLNAAGQWAFAPLTNSMGFSLGSDTGLRGLPGSLMSGDTGWLGTTELNWTFWRNRNQALQLVPFIGVGGIESTRHNVTVNDTVGSGGVIARWIAGKQWQIELGWSDQFEADDNSGFWNNWLLGSGIYSNIKFRF